MKSDVGWVLPVAIVILAVGSMIAALIRDKIRYRNSRLRVCPRHAMLIKMKQLALLDPDNCEFCKGPSNNSGVA